MHEESRELLESSGWMWCGCRWCSCPDINYSGNSDKGVLQIECGECGARYVRLTRSLALAWTARQFITALVTKQNNDACRRWNDMFDLYAYGAGVLSSELTWIMTRQGGGDDDAEGIPL